MVQGIENTEPAVFKDLSDVSIEVCQKCPQRFLCYTKGYGEDTPWTGLCQLKDLLEHLSYEDVKEIHKDKAKRQGHYVITPENSG